MRKFSMYKITRSIFQGIIILLCSCTAAKKVKYYSYSIETYTIDTVRRLISTSFLISYGENLFEFRARTNYNTDVYMKSGKANTSISYDTLGVYLLPFKSDLYVEFDTFSLKNKIVKSGRLSEKPYGYNVGEPASNQSLNVVYPTPQKTTVNSITCYYSDLVKNDTVTQRAFLIRDKNFISFYNLNGIRFPGNEYSVFGLSVYNSKEKQGFVQEIRSLRKLSESERSICESMISKSKLFLAESSRDHNKQK